MEWSVIGGLLGLSCMTCLWVTHPFIQMNSCQLVERSNQSSLSFIVVVIDAYKFYVAYTDSSMLRSLYLL
ncbi:hypothetical protein HanRHA438_Chr13g0615031 [Helianthus annuus]|uniref:Uncharacterized protein n=1 Tax=Helianthus annuus TaxID=4232 RepID=A0A9K3EL60_HELAN|nr:hypothetical protein HanXRQr2_Chr13g0604601 [Helianthus annuus]KAJ0478045.1 hypothetical protein HanHA300_Chr13g0495721 [Helianthus annuus]KAJ0498923.1 hypothetical protein HanHA89_Chr13g0528361 [Helianthus annuus]KAJ0672361.1 hypothetical protein HanOQP8_Chr13g0496391 [Helianthus annuus]KAJ0850597.1 hypothetical protein HanPSC8_Chr13g0582621 [Helianthus annuus]